MRCWGGGMADLARFEAWCEANGYYTTKWEHHDSYFSDYTNTAWAAWQEATRQAAVTASPPLHKHTGRLSWFWHRGRFYFNTAIAEDPASPLWRRTWGHAIEGGVKHSLIEFARLAVAFEDGTPVSAYSITLGPLKVTWALFPGGRHV